LKITEENYKEIVLKRAIILCWVLLAICFVIKIFGGNFFEIVCTNEKFIKVCEFIENTIIFDILQLISFVFTYFLLFKCIDMNNSKKNTIIFIIYALIYFTFKELIKFNVIVLDTAIHNILEFLLIYVFMVIFCNQKAKFHIRIFKPLLFVSLLLVFSLISVIVRNIGIHSSLNESVVMGLIFLIDYYIMILLTYFYMKRRNKNG
jgi:hypothetical protein